MFFRPPPVVLPAVDATPTPEEMSYEKTIIVRRNCLQLLPPSVTVWLAPVASRDTRSGLLEQKHGREEGSAK